MTKCKYHNYVLVRTGRFVCTECGHEKASLGKTRKSVKIGIVCLIIIMSGLFLFQNKDFLLNQISTQSNVPSSSMSSTDNSSAEVKIPIIQNVLNSSSATFKQIENSVEKGKQNLGNTIGAVTDAVNPKPPPSKDELYQYALGLVNEDRKSHGVSPVTLSNIPSAQAHADDLLSTKYFSHWNTKGVKPYVTYTTLGGRGGVAENVSYVYSYCPTSNCLANSFDPFKQINDSENRMMYDDAASNWGHRENIINPDHTSVNFGIAYDNARFYFVEHFENNLISWTEVKMDGTMLHLVGQIPPGYSLANIDLYSDPAPRFLDEGQLDSTAPYNLPFYDQGQLVGVLLPQLSGGYYYPECSPGKTTLESADGSQCVEYVIFSNSALGSNEMDLNADVSKWLGSGLHTIYVYLKKPSGGQVSAASLTLEYLK